MNKLSVLVVEDDYAIRNLITTTLEIHNYLYFTAENGATAISETSSYNPDMILMDLGLPGLNEVETIRKIRAWSMVPIIILSTRSDHIDKINALDAGADDYLTKPFSVKELLECLRLAKRRLAYMQSNPVTEQSAFTNGNLKIDYAAGLVSLNGSELYTTPIEYKLLCLLAHNVGRILTHTFITNAIWGSAWENDVAFLQVCMASLRRKMKKDPSASSYIQTQVGIGYRMIEKEQGSVCKNIHNV